MMVNCINQMPIQETTEKVIVNVKPISNTQVFEVTHPVVSKVTDGVSLTNLVATYRDNFAFLIFALVVLHYIAKNFKLNSVLDFGIHKQIIIVGFIAFIAAHMFCLETSPNTMGKVASILFFVFALSNLTTVKQVLSGEYHNNPAYNQTDAAIVNQNNIINKILFYASKMFANLNTIINRIVSKCNLSSQNANTLARIVVGLTIGCIIRLAGGFVLDNIINALYLGVLVNWSIIALFSFILLDFFRKDVDITLNKINVRYLLSVLAICLFC